MSFTWWEAAFFTVAGAGILTLAVGAFEAARFVAAALRAWGAR